MYQQNVLNIIKSKSINWAVNIIVLLYLMFLDLCYCCINVFVAFHC